MFPAGFFAKSYFSGSYFAPNDSGPIVDDTGDRFKGMIVNIGRMSVRGR